MAEEKINKIEDKVKEETEKKVETKKENKETSAVEKAKTSKESKKESKVELEREYVIPLRRKVQKAQRYRRAKKAIRVIREFLVKHMRVEERDLRKIKIDEYLNKEIWFRGIKKPPARIKVIAKKYSDGTVYVELADIPVKVKFDMEKAKKREERAKKVKVHKKHEEKEIKEETEDSKEKEKASVESGLAIQKHEAKEVKHTEQVKHVKVGAPHRKSLKK